MKQVPDKLRAVKDIPTNLGILMIAVNSLIECVEELQQTIAENESPEGAFNLWGRGIDLRLKNIEKWKKDCEYMIYEGTGTKRIKMYTIAELKKKYNIWARIPATSGFLPDFWEWLEENE